MLPWNCHSAHFMDLNDDEKNCTKFQFCTENVLRDIPLFVILHNFVSTL